MLESSHLSEGDLVALVHQKLLCLHIVCHMALIIHTSHVIADTFTTTIYTDHTGNMESFLCEDCIATILLHTYLKGNQSKPWL